LLPVLVFLSQDSHNSCVSILLRCVLQFGFI
jgi:hypothetical protein